MVEIREYQGKGIATAICNKLEQQVERAGVKLTNFVMVKRNRGR